MARTIFGQNEHDFGQMLQLKERLSSFFAAESLAQCIIKIKIDDCKTTVA